MKAYFNRNVPFYVLSPTEVDDSIGFDSYPIETSYGVLRFAQQARHATACMEKVFQNNPAPEECAQAEADAFAEAVIAVLETNGVE